MGFFTREQKKLALSCDNDCLTQCYRESEIKLKAAAKTGSEKELKKAMQEHGKFEYALLYRNTPQFKKKVNKKRGL